MAKKGYVDEFGIEINADNELRGTKCPVTPGRLRELYLGHRRDGVWHEPMGSVEIGQRYEVHKDTVLYWLKKMGVLRRNASKNKIKPATTKALQEWKRSSAGVYALSTNGKKAYVAVMAKCPDWLQRARAARSLKRTRLRSCSYCQKEIRVWLCSLKHGKGKYCSRSCASKALRGYASIGGLFCPKCLHESLRKNGFMRGKQQHRCARCNRLTIHPLTEKPHPYDVEVRHQQLRAQGVDLKALPGKDKAPSHAS